MQHARLFNHVQTGVWMSEVQAIDGEWLTFTAAAVRLGKSEPAVRVQAKRDKWLTRKDGRLVEISVPRAEIDAAQRQAVSVQTPSNEPPERALALQHDQTLAGLLAQITALRGDLSERDQRIGSLTEQLRTARRVLRRAEAQRDGLNVALAKLAGTWPDTGD
jgi:chromosome segregation ATPase